MKTEEIIDNLSKALLGWYDFRKESRALFVSGGFPECEVLFDVLKEKNPAADRACAEELAHIDGRYDYIVMAGVIEKCKNPAGFLTALKEKLSAHGKLLIAADNRFGLRYFCGEKDLHSGYVFDGIDNYCKVSSQRREEIGGRSYSGKELKRLLEEAGIVHYRFYAVLPEIVRPQMLLREGYIPNERLEVRIFPQYNSPETIYLEEEFLYGALLENDMFYQMANGYFIECSMDGVLTEADQITIQGDRSVEEALATILQRDRVCKIPLYREGSGKIKELINNTLYLKRHNVPMIDAAEKDGRFVMPFVRGRIATDYFRDMLRRDKKEFIHELGKYRDIILASSEHVPYDKIDWRKFEPGWEKRKEDDPNIDKWEKLANGAAEERENIGIILERGFIDLVSLNCFYTESGFLFFDQEFYIKNLPANVIFIRTVDFIYRDCPEMEQLYSREDVLKYFKLFEHQNTWRRMGNDFLEELRNEKKLLSYHKCVRRDSHTVAANRLRMNYTQEEYDRLFNHIFDGIDNKSLFLFGSGIYAERFVEKYGDCCKIAGIIDNNEEKWGLKLAGIPIMGSEVLSEQETAFKVFICIKFYEDVLRQLKEMGVRDISVFDPRIDYRRPIKTANYKEKRVPKKYHVGYVAGVFDLFHIGHLNLLRRAKEMCDYLIVGIVSDEQVIKNKKTKPYIAFEERKEIVQACRYVDEAVKIPMESPNTEDAYYLYHFDVQFSGSDYEDDPVWKSKQEFLRSHGAELVFFPYTQSTSSTKIKKELSVPKPDGDRGVM